MRASLFAFLASALFLAGCGHDAGRPDVLASPVGPTAVTGLSFNGSSTPDGEAVEVPFHSELRWTKTSGSEVSLCTRRPPEGKIFLMRNTNTGTAVSTHLGIGDYENHTCVYGAPGGPPEGWLADVRWTAANGDVLLATSDFLYWTGAPGRSVAVDKVTFQDGGTGRFRFATGEGMSYVDAPARTAVYEGILRYGRKGQ